MCGIYGWLGPDIDPVEAMRQRDMMVHRGPDGAGYWEDRDAQVWLGHRRLSIFDLSDAGQQPMASHSDRFRIVFNGEVFNFIELRAELEKSGHRFTSNSDTEVVLCAIEQWGLEQALARFVGMFAFGLWDRSDRSLTLVRDRLGIKPLYYTHQANRFAFASELRPLTRLPWVSGQLDPQALADYMRHLCVPAPATALKDVRKLLPGHLLRFAGGEASVAAYWSLERVAAAGRSAPLTLSFEEAAFEYERLAKEAVSLRMRSDVPYGALLSGGIDSSLVTALMASLSDRPVQTFTVGFRNAGNDESPYGRAVAEHLGTRHHELMLGPEAVPDLAAEISRLHDEPFADGSSLPTLALARFARQHVTVALGGDGGDETFGGYPRYFWADRISTLRRRLGGAGVGLTRTLMKRLPAGLIDGPFDLLSGRRLSGTQKLSSRVRRFADYLDSDPARVDTHMLAAWASPGDVLLSRDFAVSDRLGPWSGMEWSRQMMAIDQQHYLPDDILVKLDRMTMSTGLEARVPFLDHRLVEWSWRVPTQYLFAPKGERGKLLMRSALSRYVPDALIERPKAGFGMPLDEWLRGSLRAWAEEILSPDAIRRAGIFNEKTVSEVWQAHLTGQNRLNQVWTVLMLQNWLSSMSDTASRGVV